MGFGATKPKINLPSPNTYQPQIFAENNDFFFREPRNLKFGIKIGKKTVYFITNINPISK